MQLENKVALITGAKRIGIAVAGELASRGADIALSYVRSRAEAEEGVATVRAAGRRGEAFKADLAVPTDCVRLVESVVQVLGGIDILVNMASVYSERPFADLSAADWNDVLDVDLRSTFICAHTAAPHMKARGGGRIVNFSDWIAKSGRPRYKKFLPYYVAKAGVIALTEALALELAPDNILVNAIAPGPILPPPDTTQDEQAAIVRSTPLGRLGGAQEIAKAVLALIDSDFTTGETIRVDGGRHLR